MRKTFKGNAGSWLIAYSVLFWGIVFLSSTEFKPWIAVLFLSGFVLIYLSGIFYHIHKKKYLIEAEGETFYRLSPYSRFGMNSPLLIWFLIEIHMGNELFWMYFSGVIYLVGVPLLEYFIDKKYQLQRIVISDMQITITERGEVTYEWKWLRGNCLLKGRH